MIKTAYTIGNREITAYIPSKTSYEALINLYDCCNELFFADNPQCFYTSNEVLQLKKDKNNKFLKKGVKLWIPRD